MSEPEGGSWVRRLAGSRLAFCALLAAALVGARLVCFDFEMFFSLRYLPNHDMTAEMPFFVTNAHSARLSGDLAWWNPISHGGHGYAQYYQAFLSPMAPTCGHVVFVVWMQAVYLLNLVGMRVPEYVQYLLFTYALMPFLAFFSFSYFASQLFRRRATIALVGVAYALSGVGVWHSAWFYFQEPFTLFFLLGAALAAVRRPCRATGAVLLAAALIQLASFNYWTVYNSWFVAILVGSYALTHRPRVAAAWRSFAGWACERRGETLAVAVGTAAVAAAWALLLGSIVREQGTSGVRNNFLAKEGRQGYTKAEALARVQPARWFTLELFNPKVSRATENYPTGNPAHCARYIGVGLLPLALLFPAMQWGRLDRWLAVSAAAVFCVCLAPPVLLSLWEVQPGANRVCHFFYFYTHHWQVMVILAAGRALDALTRNGAAEVRGRARLGAAGLFGIAALALVIVSGLSDHYGNAAPALEAIAVSGALLMLTCAALYQLSQAAGPRGYALYSWLLVGLLFCDLTRYFAEACHKDHEFTRSLMNPHTPYPMPEEAVEAMLRPWANPHPSDGFGGNADNLPIRTQLWPDNNFMRPRAVHQAAYASGEILKATPSPVRFFPRAAEPIDDDDLVPVAAALGERLFDGLFLQGLPTDGAGGMGGAGTDLDASFTRQNYNAFRFRVDAPADGWLLLRVLHDEGWQVRIDGKLVETRQANLVRMAVPVAAGPHEVELNFRPLSRSLYWPACWLLEAALAGLAAFAWCGRRLAIAVAVPAVAVTRAA